jgi:hypothetical protein
MTGQKESSSMTSSHQLWTSSLADHEYAAVIFYSTSGGSSAAADRAASRLRALERDPKASVAYARVDDSGAAVAYGLPAAKLPGLILFDDGVPEVAKAYRATNAYLQYLVTLFMSLKSICWFRFLRVT